jgi:hypothetical protein
VTMAMDGEVEFGGRKKTFFPLPPAADITSTESTTYLPR